jgi:hypothetical protein
MFEIVRLSGTGPTSVLGLADKGAVMMRVVYLLFVEEYGLPSGEMVDWV